MSWVLSVVAEGKVEVCIVGVVVVVVVMGVVAVAVAVGVGVVVVVGSKFLRGGIYAQSIGS